MDFPPSKSIRPAPYKQQVLGKFMDMRQETRDFKTHSEMVYNMRVRSLRGRINGVEGW
jgi:hypothetical protein